MMISPSQSIFCQSTLTSLSSERQWTPLSIQIPVDFPAIVISTCSTHSQVSAGVSPSWVSQVISSNHTLPFMEWPVLLLADMDPQLRSFYLPSSAPQVAIDISILKRSTSWKEAARSDTGSQYCTAECNAPSDHSTLRMCVVMEFHILHFNWMLYCGDKSWTS